MVLMGPRPGRAVPAVPRGHRAEARIEQRREGQGRAQASPGHGVEESLPRGDIVAPGAGLAGRREGGMICDGLMDFR